MSFVFTNMRYNPRTDNALDIDVIAKQCMDAVREADFFREFGIAMDEAFGSEEELAHGPYFVG